MKKPTNKLTFQSAFSLVELLVVIAVIAVIAAIAIPNIAGITGQAAITAAKRNAQNMASVASAARAAGWTNPYTTEAEFATALTNGTVSNALGAFRVDGLSAADMSNALGHLTFSNVQGGLLIYAPTN
ncbi:MAG: prepilin-type N-terminal cleavage/methylation domain-containing protein [Terrimicrobiaceae bacterium]